MFHFTQTTTKTIINMTHSMPTIASGDYFNQKQTSEILGLHRNTIRRYTFEGVRGTSLRLKCSINLVGDCIWKGEDIIDFWKRMHGIG